MMSLRKLKKMDGYFGRLFADEQQANQWLERMQMKMGSTFVYDKRPHKEGSANLTLAFLHKG